MREYIRGIYNRYLLTVMDANNICITAGITHRRSVGVRESRRLCSPPVDWAARGGQPWAFRVR